MAMAAYLRAREHAADEADTPLAGIGCTASLASDRPKHGPHRIYAALQTGETTIACHLELVKSARTREAEELVAAAMILNLAAQFKQLAESADLALAAEEELLVARADAPQSWQRLLSGTERLAAGTTGIAAEEGRDLSAKVLFPGAFHPRHDAHRTMAQLAAEQTGRVVEHEISIVNVDKPPIDFIEMERRAAQFAAGERLWFARAPTFVEKSQIFPGATFVVGVDTIVRIAEAKYYGDAPARDAALEQLAAAGCRFLVFSRRHDGIDRSLRELNLPDVLRRICDEVPAETFRMDVSSTALRRQAAGATGQRLADEA
jgi:nicotinic acid mononucleotide adenylyltransferase